MKDCDGKFVKNDLKPDRNGIHANKQQLRIISESLRWFYPPLTVPLLIHLSPVSRLPGVSSFPRRGSYRTLPQATYPIRLYEHDVPDEKAPKSDGVTSKPLSPLRRTTGCVRCAGRIFTGGIFIPSPQVRTPRISLVMGEDLGPIKWKSSRCASTSSRNPRI